MDNEEKDLNQKFTETVEDELNSNEEIKYEDTILDSEKEIGNEELNTNADEVISDAFNKEENNTEDTLTFNNKNNKKNNPFVIIILILLLIIIGIGLYFVWDKYIKDDNKKGSNTNEPTTTKIIEPTTKNNNNQNYDINESTYDYKENPLIDFDLFFLKIENDKKNKVYSPISIKYALKMLEDGANGETKTQIEEILKDYNVKKYKNNENLSFTNALFVRDTFKDSINENYEGILKKKYNGSLIYDPFTSPNVINEFISKNTLGLINNLLEDVSDKDFVLVNALAIDMEWVNKLSDRGLWVTYQHEKFGKYQRSIEEGGYYNVKFDGVNYETKAVPVGLVVNRYDIIKELGEENIRKTVGDAYQAWLDEGDFVSYHNSDMWPDVDTYLDSYIEEISSNYKKFEKTTDFSFYVDDDVKVFAKDLKEYNGVTLEYVGIMPKNISLENFINGMDAAKINNIISNLKPAELESFKDGVITFIDSTIPLFNFDYELNLNNDLKLLGINSVFDNENADLSNMFKTPNIAIDNVLHKANIDFSNDGIKAAAALTGDGKGGGDPEFDYLYDVPVEEIDLTFDKPYMFIIRDKNTKEVWFTGTVYEPSEWEKGFSW